MRDTNTATETVPMALEAAALLQLMWLASPALPVGAFSYSEGLEPAVDAGLVHDEASAADWLSDQLWLVAARAELPAVAHAMQAWLRHDAREVLAINEWTLRTRETSEQRAQALQMGRSLLAWLRHGEHAGDARLAWVPVQDLTWPVAFALAATLAAIDERHALLAHAFGWAENMAQAAIKAVPLGQVAAQRVLLRLTGEIPDAVDQAMGVAPGARQAFAPMLAIRGAMHETQYSRIFRS
jgi:urease accessory protein